MDDLAQMRATLRQFEERQRARGVQGGGFIDRPESDRYVPEQTVRQIESQTLANLSFAFSLSFMTNIAPSCRSSLLSRMYMVAVRTAHIHS
jgi:hypothetical protein